MDCIVHRIAKSQTLQSDFHFLFTELKRKQACQLLDLRLVGQPTSESKPLSLWCFIKASLANQPPPEMAAMGDIKEGRSSQTEGGTAIPQKGGGLHQPRECFHPAPAPQALYSVLPQRAACHSQHFGILKAAPLPHPKSQEHHFLATMACLMFLCDFTSMFVRVLSFQVTAHSLEAGTML